MTTATGQVAVNYAALGNVDPYTNGNFGYVGTGRFKVASGTLAWASGASPAAQYYNGTMGAGTVKSKIEVGTGFTGGDEIGAAIIDSSGNGYVFKLLTSTNGSLQSLTALSPGAIVNSAVTGGIAGGDVFELWWATNGDLRVYKNGVLDTAFNANDTTFSTGLAFGPFITADNYGVATIISFAGDGIAAGGSLIPSSRGLYGNLAANLTGGFRG